MRILLTGASGQLGGYVLRELRSQASALTAWSNERTGELFGVRLHPIDLSDENATRIAFEKVSPEVVIHTAGRTKVSDCFERPDVAHSVNVGGTEALTRLAAATDARFIFTSTDMVFNGERGNYAEDDVTSPLSSYARTKRDAERCVSTYENGLVARMSLMFGLTQSLRSMFFDTLVSKLRSSQPYSLYEDEWRTPLDLQTAARCLVALAHSDICGVVHVGGLERMNRYEMGLRLARHLGCDEALLQPCRSADEQHTEPRPRDLSLNISRLKAALPDFEFPAYDDALKLVCSG